MRIIYVHLFGLILLYAVLGHAVPGESNQSYRSDELDEKCGVYVNQIVKPMFAYFEQVNRNNSDAEAESKNSRIRQLEERETMLLKEVTQLKVEVASARSKIIKLLEEKNDSNAEYLKQKYQNSKGCNDRDSTGVHNVTTANGFTFEVLCNPATMGPGWTVIQQRIRGGVDFNMNWTMYRNGFGDFWDGDFFLGLEKIHRLTTEQPHELYIHMQNTDKSTFYARYDQFAISGEDNQYQLINLGEFTGSAKKDNLAFAKNQRFSTYDSDNDDSTAHCAVKYQTGWWHKNCYNANLNGIYFESNKHRSLHWENGHSLKEVRMMIRPKAF